MQGFLNQKFGQATLPFFLFIGILALASIFFGKSIAGLSAIKSFLLIGGLVAFSLTFINPRIGLLIIVFSMLLFPALKAGTLPGRDVLFRVEDFLLIVVVLTWFVKTALQKELAVFTKTPLNLPIGIYFLVCVISTLRGAMMDTTEVLKSFFYLIKYLEYFLIYFMVISLIQDKRQAKFFIIMLLVTCVITSIYADWHIGSIGRVSGPFQDEPNTLGGYLTIMIALIMGLLLQDVSFKFKFFLAASLLFIVPAFLFTLSRTSYLAIIPMCIGLMIFSRRKLLITVLFFLGIIGFAIFLPQQIHKRIDYTFAGEVAQGIKPVVFAGKELDPSSSSRIISWATVLDKWQERPILGYGITGVGFIDGEYLLILGEMGILGILAFIFLLRVIFKYSKKIFLEAKDPFFRGVSLGFLAGFIGFIFFNIGANGFIIIRIMEPFWFLAAIVMLIPKLESHELLLSK